MKNSMNYRYGEIHFWKEGDQWIAEGYIGCVFKRFTGKTKGAAVELAAKWIDGKIKE